jgi:hypothetical protein
MNFISQTFPHTKDEEKLETFLCEDVLEVIFDFLLLKEQVQFSSVSTQIRKIFLGTENFSIHMIHSHYHRLRIKIKSTSKFSQINNNIQSVIKKNIQLDAESKLKQNLISNWNLPNDYFKTFSFEVEPNPNELYRCSIKWGNENFSLNIEAFCDKGEIEEVQDFDEFFNFQFLFLF